MAWLLKHSPCRFIFLLGIAATVSWEPSLGQSLEPSHFLDLDGESVFRAGALLPDGGVLAVGSLQTTSGNSVAILRGSNAAGRALFTARVLPSSAISSIFINVARLPGGDYVATGWLHDRTATHDDCMVSRIRPSGDLVWMRQIAGAGTERCYFALPAGANTILAGGRYEPANDPSRKAFGLLFALKADTGEIITGSRHEFAAGSARRSAFRSAVVLPDGTVALGGWATDEARHGDDVWIMRVTPRLQPIWQWRWGVTGDAIATGLAYAPDGRIIAVGTDGRQRALAVSLGEDGQPRWQSTYPIGQAAASELQQVRVTPDQAIVAFGWALDAKDGPAHAMILKIDRNGLAAQPTVLRDFPESRAYDGLLSDHGVLLLGAATRIGAAHGTAWIQDQASFMPTPDNLRQTPTMTAGDSKGGVPAQMNGRLSAGQIGHYRFAVERIGPIRVAAIPQAGDIDIILRTEKGQIVRISDNSGTAAELIAETVPAGNYDVEVTCTEDALFRLEVTTDARPAATQEAVALEMSWQLPDRQRVQHALDLLGYHSGEGQGVFTAATRVAIQAFQASLGHPPSGSLTKSERLVLSVKAAESAVRRAEAAAKEAAKAVADPESSAKMESTEERVFTGRFGGDVVLGVGSRAGSEDAQFEGEWQRIPGADDQGSAVYVPHGFGIFTYRRATEQPLQWVGEFGNWSELDGFGLLRLEGAGTIYAGEWTALDVPGANQESQSTWRGHRPSGYGVAFANFDDNKFSHLPAGGFWQVQADQTRKSLLTNTIPYQ